MTGMELGGVSCTTYSDVGSIHGEGTGSQPLPATGSQHVIAPSEPGAATATGSRGASAHEASVGAAELQEELQALRARATTAEVQAAHERARAAALRLDAASAVEVVNTTLAVVSAPAKVGTTTPTEKEKGAVKANPKGTAISWKAPRPRGE